MKIIGLLNWYDENPAWLAESVAAAARICDHIIAVDGPYAAFPGAMKKPYSSSEEADVIARTAAGFGIGATIHQPRQPWWGGEVEKRNLMFQLGASFATPQDWFFRFDADEVISDIPLDINGTLSDSEHDVAELTLWQRPPAAVAQQVDTADFESPLRCLFRNLPGIRIEHNHYTVIAGDDTVLNGRNQAPALDMSDLRLEHRTHQRTKARLRLKGEYDALIPDIEREAL